MRLTKKNITTFFFFNFDVMKCLQIVNFNLELLYQIGQDFWDIQHLFKVRYQGVSKYNKRSFIALKISFFQIIFQINNTIAYTLFLIKLDKQSLILYDQEVLSNYYCIIIYRSRKKSYFFLVVRPLRPYHPPPLLELRGHIFSDFFVEVQKNLFSQWPGRYQPNPRPSQWSDH